MLNTPYVKDRYKQYHYFIQHSSDKLKREIIETLSPIFALRIFFVITIRFSFYW